MKKIKSLLCALSSITIAMTSIGAAVPTVMATETTDTSATDEVSTGYHYVYAGLTWAEYWASEGVYNADNVSSSDVADSRGETDKGGFDAVSRATTNHGLHRGSYQCMTTIETEDGSKYGVSYWTSTKDADGKTITTLHTTDGEEVTFAKGVLTFADGTSKKMVDYSVTGLKYIPVAVADADYEDFCKNYTVVENGGQLIGGYSEGNLKSYDLKSNVTADTNGLKEAVKNSDGTFSFKSRSTGEGSGIADTALKTVADTVVAEVKSGEDLGNYGEFLRVDLTGDGYGELGEAMQAVKWTYYGSDSTHTKALQTYGTKFAADNWMHKAMGIQLGLTDSARCQLPEGTDGTGYWSLTVYALGYEDYTVDFRVPDYVYGTMDIPYNDFFKAEGTFEKVDAVSSATTSKFTMNEAGKLSEGTYHTVNKDSTGGTIDGVTYPVAVDKALIEEYPDVISKYNFKENENQTVVPEAYKIFGYDSADGDVDFSAVQDETPVTKSDVKVSLETSTKYGDYQLKFESAPYDNTKEVFYGAVVTTDDGKTYPMTILENWWRPKNELAWSIGFIGSEKSKVHNANVLKYDETKDLTDKTIKSVTFITSSGYTTVNTDIYLPKKTGLDADVIKVADAKISDGKAAVTVDLPEDYKAVYTSSPEGLTVENGNVVVSKDTLPGKYTLTVSDENGKNVSYSASFVLSTDEVAATVSKDGKSIAAASGVSADAFSNYIKNITSVKVGDKSYSASGKGSVKLINDDGTINESVTTKDKEGNEKTTDYIKSGDVITISANGYADITLTYGKAVEEPTTEPITEPVVKKNKGDVNGDTKVDSKDAVLILQAYAKSLVNDNSSTIDVDAADLNSDGKVDSKDAVLVLQYYAKALVDGDKAVSVEEFLKSKNK
ncbi:MAG: penicillin-binding Tp47 domain C-containing protein [Oscillospiraceae bacterium]|nr:penicillin-binding Tp47 domain C-containing protein [Oscillospiraceae bacterium]